MATLEYNYSYAFEFEKAFHMETYTKLMETHFHWSFYISAVYVLTIFTIKWIMKNRQPFVLRRELAAWNTALAAFSLWALYRMLPEIWHSFMVNGATYSFCNNSFAKGVTGLYSFLFAISKIFELGDTLFVVLRKQNLIFLHWYHHITVLIYTWLAYFSYTASGRWFITMNLAVHSFMYSYYALKATRFIHIPKSIPLCITLSQLTQMVVGCYAQIHNYREKSAGRACHQTYNNIYLGLIMYASYFLLFAHFFATNYFGSGKFVAKEKIASQKEKTLLHKENGHTNGVIKRRATKVE